MGLAEWRKDRAIKQKMTIREDGKEIPAKDVEKYFDGEELAKLAAEELNVHAAINLIANSISKCEFQTFLNGEEYRGEEFYMWNFEPNRNQNASQFRQELVERLLYKNECLVVEVSGQLIIAESYTKEEFALNETIFRNVYRKGLTLQKDYRMSEVLFFRLNNKNIRKLLAELCVGYDELLEQAIDKYEKAGGEKGTLHIDAQAQGMKYGNRTFEEVYEDLMNERFKKFFNSRSAVLPLFNGFTYTKQAAEQSKKSTSEMKDITDMLDEIAATVARAFNVPVGLLKGDVTEVDKVTKNLLTFCVDPICEMIQKEINRKRYGKREVLKKNYLRIDTMTVMHTDIFDIAEKLDKLIACGMYSIDEMRKKLGDSELGTEEARAHFITKNYERVENLKGGEGDGTQDEV